MVCSQSSRIICYGFRASLERFSGVNRVGSKVGVRYGLWGCPQIFCCLFGR